MRNPASWLTVFANIATLISTSNAQTYSNCNPLTQSGCPADTALGKAVNIDFTQGASDSFTPQGNPTYDSNGVSFTVRKSGDSPQITSKWYIMFGKVDVVLKAAPGTGIVSSFVMQSDDLVSHYALQTIAVNTNHMQDEIDWEWLGANSAQVQSNYFGKGLTTTYDRGAFHADPDNQAGFQTYSIDWTANQIVWQIGGKTVRALTAANAAPNQYPQTPMQIKIGAWSAGDPSNSQGTIAWAGGNTDYSKGPFTMQVKSVTVTDYSTGTQYKYNGNSGSWQSIVAVGGTVNPGGNSNVQVAGPAVTSVSSGQPLVFASPPAGSPIVSTPSGYPWVPLTTLSTAAASATYSNYPGLPSGWTVSSSGKAVPPSGSALVRTNNFSSLFL